MTRKRWAMDRGPTIGQKALIAAINTHAATTSSNFGDELERTVNALQESISSFSNDRSADSDILGDRIGLASEIIRNSVDEMADTIGESIAKHGDELADAMMVHGALVQAAGIAIFAGLLSIGAGLASIDYTRRNPLTTRANELVRQGANLVDAFRSTGQNRLLDLARSRLDEALEVNPADGLAYLLRGRAAALEGLNVNAEDDFIAAIGLSSERDMIRLELAGWYYRWQRPDAALEQLKAMSRSDDVTEMFETKLLVSLHRSDEALSRAFFCIDRSPKLLGAFLTSDELEPISDDIFLTYKNKSENLIETIHKLHSEMSIVYKYIEAYKINNAGPIEYIAEFNNLKINKFELMEYTEKSLGNLSYENLIEEAKNLEILLEDAWQNFIFAIEVENIHLLKTLQHARSKNAEYVNERKSKISMLESGKSLVSGFDHSANTVGNIINALLGVEENRKRQKIDSINYDILNHKKWLSVYETELSTIGRKMKSHKQYYATLKEKVRLREYYQYPRPAEIL